MSMAREILQRIHERRDKATVIELDRLQYFTDETIFKLLDSLEFHKARLGYDPGTHGGRPRAIGGTKKDTVRFAKALIRDDIEAGKELEGTGFSLGADLERKKEADYKYLKSIR